MATNSLSFVDACFIIIIVVIFALVVLSKASNVSLENAPEKGKEAARPPARVTLSEDGPRFLLSGSSIPLRDVPADSLSGRDVVVDIRQYNGLAADLIRVQKFLINANVKRWAVTPGNK